MSQPVCDTRVSARPDRAPSPSTASFSTWMGMSMNHLVGGRAFTLFGRTRKGGSGWNRPVDSFLIRDEAGRTTDLWNSSRRCYDYWSLRRKREGGEGERERERRKTGWDVGEERTRGMRGQALVGDVQVSSSRKVLSRAKILHFDVSQFYLILQRVGGSIARWSVIFH